MSSVRQDRICAWSFVRKPSRYRSSVSVLADMRAEGALRGGCRSRVAGAPTATAQPRTEVAAARPANLHPADGDADAAGSAAAPAPGYARSARQGGGRAVAGLL